MGAIAAAPFAGRAPIDLICLSFEHQLEVRQYLAGVVYTIASNEADINFKPYTIDNIIWH